MSKGAIAPTDPAAWTIHNDKLYFNDSVDVRELWLGDVAGNVRKADRHWAEKLKSGIDA